MRCMAWSPLVRCLRRGVSCRQPRNRSLYDCDPFVLGGPQFPLGSELPQDVEGADQAWSCLIIELCQLEQGNDQIDLPVSIAGIKRCQCLADHETLAKGLERLLGPTRLGQRSTDPLVADRHVALPLGIARIDSHESFSDQKAPAIGIEGKVFVTRREQNTADIVVADRQIPLPLGIARIGSGELATNRQARTIGFKGFFSPARLNGPIADPVLTDRQIPLPMGIAGVSVGEPFDDRNVLAVMRQRLVLPPGRHKRIANFVIAD